MSCKMIGALIIAIAAMGSSICHAKEPGPERQQQLLHLLKQDCGSCHGMTLKGGLGPDLLSERMAILPREFIVATIAKGRPGTPMPPWENLLSASDIEWLAGQLQQGVE